MIALIITVLAVFVFAALLFPVAISFDSARSGGKIEGSFSMSWIIFLLRYAPKEKQLDIHIFGRQIFRRIFPEKKPKELERIKERKKSRNMPPVRDLLNITGPVLRLFKDLVRAFRIKYLDIDITFGLNDPAYTGIMTGFLHAAGLSRTGHNIRWVVDFTGQVFDWDIKGKAVLIPVRLIPPVTGFITSRQVLRSGWRIIKG